jgi:hypothetical protein
MFRPGYIQPRHGVVAKTKWVRLVYAVVGPLYPLLRALFKNQVTTTEQLGRAMLRVAGQGCSKQILESRDINTLA